ncbi:MAG: SAM-dependent methyltransferase [Labilithrix sp.]|nr:SAM-dependent methyltransferase [Labilithrix sp.]MCW5811521.1 SAM-dependent methyltransferase [Labilithrix sp.]
MPSHLKKLVRSRMEKTGESYEQALRHVRAQEEREPTSTPAADTSYTKSSARSRSVADTAFSVAAVRAEEAERPEPERLFEDPYAASFAAAGAHVAEATQRFLDLPFFRDGIRLRTRFIDDFVREGIAAGLTQLVLLGAGFDARGLRIPEIAERRVSVYEIDTPDQLQRKRSILMGARVKSPATVVPVPFDFDTDDFENELTAALVAKGFQRDPGTLYVWEGVIGYIDSAAIARSLRFMANAAGPRSRLVFTYGDGTFAPDTAETRCRQAGFTSFEELGGDELWRRYLPGAPHPNAWAMKLGTAAV